MPSYDRRPKVVGTIEIAANDTVSTASRDLASLTLVGLRVIGDWTIADLTFEASDDGTTWFELATTDGAAVTVTPGADTQISLDPVLFASCRRIRATSSTAQTATRTIALIAREVA